MFTGIIDHCGKITAIEDQGQTLRLWIQTKFTDLQLGESIALDGACLTVTAIKDDSFCCDVSSETLKLTTMVHWARGTQVNLERALRPMDRMGGHVVTGHIDRIAELRSKAMEQEFCRMEFVVPAEEARKYLVKKGSVAVNGVSLTINEVLPGGFAVMLIPHTLERTNLSKLAEGAAVNIEYDILTKTVAEQVANYLMNADLSSRDLIAGSINSLKNRDPVFSHGMTIKKVSYERK